MDLGVTADARSDLTAVAAEANVAEMVAFGVLSLAGLARLELVAGEPHQALRHLREARAALVRRTPRSQLLAHVDGVEALVRIWLGDAVRAERLIAGLPRSTTSTLLAVRLAQLRRPGSGLARLEAMQPADPRTAVERAVLLAQALADSHPSQAAEWLVTAADAAEPEGLRLALLGLSEPVLAIGRSVAGRTGHDRLTRLLEVADELRGPTPADPGHLSSGERELLALLPGRDSNKAIAAKLYVSVNTVKTRLRRLYAKLGVNSRDDAVRVARQRGLVS